MLIFNYIRFDVSNLNDDKIGTKTERMRIDSGGTVGIGISAPTRHPLHIYGGNATEFHMTNVNI